MNIQANLSSTNFSAQLPKKQTYNAMKKYYKSIGDKDTSKAFALLENTAKARLHTKKSDIAQQKILDLSEKISEESISGKELLKFFLTQSKNTMISIKELILASYYNIKKAL